MPEITEKIKVALGYGDLSENSEYDEAKNEQAFTEGRIIQLENMLKNAVVVDENEIPKDKVSVGSIVKVKDYDFDEIKITDLVNYFAYKAGANVEVKKINRIENLVPLKKNVLFVLADGLGAYKVADLNEESK